MCAMDNWTSISFIHKSDAIISLTLLICIFTRNKITFDINCDSVFSRSFIKLLSFLNLYKNALIYF